MCGGRNVKTPIHLYRYLLRIIKTLPEENRDYYKHFVRQSYNSHSDEDDTERIQQIIERSMEDAEWVKSKFKKDTSTSDDGTKR